MQYNASQQKAIAFKTGPMLVLAGPGSGKTAVITERVRQLTAQGVPAENILVVTFTRAAAAEMKSRYLALAGEEYTSVTFGTFHGVFYGILRKSYNFSGAAVIGEEEKLKLCREILAGTYRDYSGDQDLPSQTAQEISLVKNNRIPIDSYYSGTIPAEAFRRIYREYVRWMNENRRLDFDDLVLRTFELFTKRPDILEKWQNKFKYILIDEFQDINPVQYEIVRMLARPENNLFIVGDDDQSIYRFRSASPELMLSFPKLYPAASTVLLNLNYRSTPEILSASLKVIAANKKRYPKNLKAVKKPGAPVRLTVYEDVHKETTEISGTVRKLHGRGLPYEEMAVLVRTNASAGTIAAQLLSDRVPFYCQEKLPCIYDHWIARDMLAYLHLAAGSDRREEYLTVINRPNRYISREAFGKSRVNLEDLYIYYEDRRWMWERLEKLQEDLRTIHTLSPYAAVHYIRRGVGYDEYILAYAAEHNVAKEDLLSVADELEETAAAFPSVAAWEEHIRDFRQELKDSLRDRNEKKEGVRILTLHAAKGTEYEAVFIPDLNEGNIPFRKAALAEDLEEERRMLYVGMTRAKSLLYLSAVKTRFEREQKISSFLRPLIRAGEGEEE